MIASRVTRRTALATLAGALVARNAFATADQAKDWLSLNAGYRYLAVDFSDGGFRYDVALHGPIIGATIRF